MKKISWITPECYLDVDLPIINYLCKSFKIKWIVVLGKSSIDYKQYVESILENPSMMDIEYEYLEGRARSLSTLKAYCNIVKSAKAFKPDVYYFSSWGIPYALFVFRWFFPVNKCVTPCHNVTTPKGAVNENMAKIYTHLWLTLFKNIQVFSQSQYNCLVSRHHNKNVLMTYLALKDYGEPTKNVSKPEDYIRFLFFGNVANYKRVDLLIKAADILQKRGINNFKIRIAGNSRDWEQRYAPTITNPSLFELNIGRVPNEEVANQFVDSHYFVMPYQDIAQSGAITVAFRFNLPTIVSDIEPFKEFVEDGKTGMMFHTCDAESLADKMQYAIEHHTEIYSSMRKAQKHFVDKELSTDAIVKKYKDFLDRI